MGRDALMVGTVSAVATLTDGSIFESSIERREFDQAMRAGLAGKALICKLLGDDLRPPPRFVDFNGVASDDSALSLRVVFE
jgi:hypothetical protein